MQIDVPRARAETEGVSHGIHLNAAGSALMPRSVVDAQVRHIHDEAAHGGYEACQHAEAQIARTYAALGELLNCAPDQIALTDSATTSWQRIVRALPWQPGDRVLTGEAEYASNVITFLQLARHLGVEIAVVPSDADGQIDVDRLADMIDGRTRLVAVTHVPTNGGLVIVVLEPWDERAEGKVILDELATRLSVLPGIETEILEELDQLADVFRRGLRHHAVAQVEHVRAAGERIQELSGGLAHPLAAGDHAQRVQVALHGRLAL